MNICSTIEFINDEYGGPAVSLPNLLLSLNNNYDVDNVILSAKESNDSCENSIIKKAGIPWFTYEISKFNKLRYSREFGRLLSKYAADSDILFANNLWNYVPYKTYAYAKSNNIPLVTSIRGTLSPWSLSQGYVRKKIAWGVFQRRMLNDSALVHVTSEDEFKAVRSLGVTSNILYSSHGIVTPDRVHEDKEFFKERLGLDKNKRYFLFMSRLHKKKGLDLLLRVWRRLSHRNKDWVLLVAGPDYGNYQEQLSLPQTKYLGMLTGELKDAAFYCSDFFVLPTFSENFGVVIGEALARGLPVLTTNNAPWQNINNIGCGNSFDLSESNLSNVLNDYFSQSKLELIQRGDLGRKYILNDYSWEKKAQEFHQELTKVL
ncbi:glycosyltransferase [Vibrio furnissii]|nr:glycosyltransferase [Vibrio furnissii]